MKNFAALRKHLVTCGIEMPQKSTSMHPLNVRNSIICFNLCVFVTLIALSLNDANTFDEYTDILFKSVSISGCSICYAIIVWRTPNLFKFMNNLQDIIQASE